MFKLRKQQRDWGIVDLTSIGMTLVFAIFIGYFAGKWIGGKLGNELVGSIIGFIMGTTAGFIEMFRSVARWNRQMEHREQREREISEDQDRKQL